MWERIAPADGSTPTYDGDFIAWAFDQARRLREARPNGFDYENLAEEIESLGKREQSKLESLLTILFLHLLKWDYQSRFRGSSWEKSVRVSRRQIAKHLRGNPSLQQVLTETVADAYEDARDLASADTGFPESIFPEANPYTFDDAMTRELRHSDPERL